MQSNQEAPVDRRRRHQGEKPILLRLVFSMSIAAATLSGTMAGPAEATTVYADPAGTCNGLTPCFTTLQDAVNHAAPAPGTVGLFPGTYAESVDLSTMGSAAGADAGDLTLQALDGAGSPATSGVVVDPGASGGPGSGPALFVASSANFPGAIRLRGLAATSPDVIGIALFPLGDIELRNLLLEGSGSAGGLLDTEGELTVRDVVARLNATRGLTAIGSATNVENVLTERNGEEGAVVVGRDSLVVRQVEAFANGLTGLQGISCSTLDAEDVTADSNDSRGAELFVDPGLCPPPSSSETLRKRLQQPDLLEDLRPLRSDSSAPPLSPLTAPIPTVVTVTGLSTNTNGDFGAGIGTVDGGAVVEGAVAEGNGGFGLVAIVDELEISDGTFTHNLGGLKTFADSVTVTQVQATDNAPGSSTPPDEGVGVLVGSLEATLIDVDAERNGFSGLVLSPASIPDSPPRYRVQGGRFAENDVGIASVGDGLLDIEISDASAEDNAIAGIALPDVDTGTIRGVRATGSPSGISARVATDLEVRESEINDNEKGVLLAVEAEARARVHCSNIRSNTPDAGLELVEGSSADARANFWGHPSGPTHPGNPGGLGDRVLDGANGAVGTVDYSGFLAAEATSADCLDPPPVLEIPTASDVVLVLLAGLLGLAGLGALRWY